MGRPRKKNIIVDPSTISSRLSKVEVIKNWANGLYEVHPELWIPHALGETLDPWQERVVRKLFLGEKHKVSVRAGHSCGKTFLSSRLSLQFLMCYSPSIVVTTGPCVEENEKILLADGRWIPIKDLNGRYFGVLAVRDNLSLTPALARAFPNGVKPVFLVKTRSGREAIRTGNHPFRTLHGWQAAATLKPGDSIGIAADLSEASGKQTLPEEEVKFVAYMLAEGYTGKLESGHITFTQNPGVVLEEFRQCVAKFGCSLTTHGLSHDIIGSKTEGGRSINPLKELCRKHKMDGKRSWDKEIPSMIFELNNDLLKVFVSRLFAGDGHVNHGTTREIRYSSVSKPLILDLNRILLRLGIRGRIRMRDRAKIKEGQKARRDLYVWYVSGEEAVKFATTIGIFSKETQCEKMTKGHKTNERLKNILFDLLPHEVSHMALDQGDISRLPRIVRYEPEQRMNRSNCREVAEITGREFFRDIARDHIAWDEVVSVSYLGERMTYGIEVDKYHTYLTDFVEHNTGKQTRGQYWSQLITAVQKSVFADDLECLATRIFIKGKSQEEWKAVWVTSKDPKTIEGFHGPDEGKNLLWQVEEAKAVADPVFEALSGALSCDNNFFYMSSTCGPPRGHFFDSHTRLRHLYDTEHIPSTESPKVSKEKIKTWKEQWGEDSPVYRARVLAEFPEEDDSAISSLYWLLRATESHDDTYNDDYEDETEAA